MRDYAAFRKTPEGFGVAFLLAEIYLARSENPKLSKDVTQGLVMANLFLQNQAQQNQQLAPAVDAIEKAYPAEDVSLYLNVLLCQDPATWGSLRPIVDAKGWG